MLSLQSWNGWMADSENRNQQVFRRRCWRPTNPCTLGRIMENARSDEAILQIGLTLMKYECFDEVSQILVQLESRGFLEPEAEQLKLRWH